MAYGSMPIDNGWLILSPDERETLLQAEPDAAPYVRPYLGGDEFLNGYERYCLWLVGCAPSVLRRMKHLTVRVEGNRAYREKSGRPQTRELAKVPALFGENRQPDSEYLLIPKVSSENRYYIPIGFCHPDIIASGTTLIVPKATLFHFGILQSAMHMAWTRATCGRLESRYQYSAGIVYNNFPWPDCSPSPARGGGEKMRAAIEAAAQAVLDARA